MMFPRPTTIFSGAISRVRWKIWVRNPLSLIIVIKLSATPSRLRPLLWNFTSLNGVPLGVKYLSLTDSAFNFLKQGLEFLICLHHRQKSFPTNAHGTVISPQHRPYIRLLHPPVPVKQLHQKAAPGSAVSSCHQIFPSDDFAAGPAVQIRPAQAGRIKGGCPHLLSKRKAFSISPKLTLAILLPPMLLPSYVCSLPEARSRIPEA